MVRPLLRLLAVLALAGLTIAACGGDDGGDEQAETTAARAESGDSGSGATDEEFCLAIEEVKAAGERLSAVELEDDEDVPATKEALFELIDALDAAVEAAPEEISEVAGQVTDLTAQVQARVEAAESADQLRNEIPLMVSILTENTQVDSEVSAEFIEFIQETCGI